MELYHLSLLHVFGETFTSDTHEMTIIKSVQYESNVKRP